MIQISVKSLHFHADAKLLDFIEQKLSRLGRYFDRPVEAEVHLKLQDTGTKINEKNYRSKNPGPRRLVDG